MALDDVVARLVDLAGSPPAARLAIAQLQPEERLPVAEGLKRQTLFQVRRDAPRALAIADLILHIAASCDDPLVRALGLQTKAIALTLLEREYEQALELFRASEAIYAEHHDELAIAVGQVARVWALACLQRFDEAYAAGDWAERVLVEHQAHRTLAALSNNLAAIYGRRGQDAQALERIRKAEAAYRQLGEEGERRLSLAQMNRAIVLRNLGRFQESIAANQEALRTAIKFAQTANVARARQNLGITYFVLGRFSQAHALLQQARDAFLEDRRFRDAILVELFISDGMLHLRRYQAVLAKCRQVRQTFQGLGTRFEVAQAMLNQATALAGLQAYEQAHTVLNEARQIFLAEENGAWQAYTDLEEALLLYRQGRYEASDRLATGCSARLAALDLPLKQAQARLVAARAASALGQTQRALDLVTQALSVGQAKDVPTLAYQCHDLRARLALQAGDHGAALTAYEAAIRELERLQDQMMVEFRADFLADKEAVYAGAVDLCLQDRNPRLALDYAERAKSRALLSLLSHHVDLHIEARSPQDRPLVAQLLALRERRDRLHRRWVTGETPGSDAILQADQQAGQVSRQEARRDIVATEDEIHKLWHRLLVRNDAYARDASLWQVQTRLDQSALGPDTLLVEYFTLRSGLAAFLVSAEAVTAFRLPVSPQDILALRQRLRHNLNTLQQVPQLSPCLARKAQRVLLRLYQALIEPFADRLQPYRRLIVVPHGPLHYLPFHALYDGHDYLVHRYQMSYLPGSSFLGLTGSGTPAEMDALVMGHTRQGRLPRVLVEARAVADSLHSTPYLDQTATCVRFRAQAPRCRVIHVAAHGDFRPHNPLFSGLHLHDGILTTLDVFNLRLSASLVTLSACQTGRSVVGGGDELFGLMRAFLAAGAASLVLTLWPVEDETSTELMTTFYDLLSAGRSKVAALQQAQSRFLRDNGADSSHPYYWAPFFLVGDTGPV